MEASLTDYRSRIDEIDAQLLHLLGERFEISRNVADHKRDAGIPMSFRST